VGVEKPFAGGLLIDGSHRNKKRKHVLGVYDMLCMRFSLKKVGDMSMMTRLGKRWNTKRGMDGTRTKASGSKRSVIMMIKMGCVGINKTERQGVVVE
jgi:hypothetical protein